MSAQKLHQSPPFRAEHLGSLKRPDYLLEKRNAFDQEKIKIQDLTPVEDAAIKDIVDKQLKWGFRAVSDGEYRWESQTYIVLMELIEPSDGTCFGEHFSLLSMAWKILPLLLPTGSDHTCQTWLRL
jgi:hypothetical protein